MKLLNTLTLFLTVVLLLFISELTAQENTLQKNEQKTVIDSINSILLSDYVFPEVANSMKSYLEEQYTKGSYASIKNANVFADKLTEDLQHISKDKHLRVRFSPQQIQERRQTAIAEDSAAFMQRYINRLKRTNFGFKEVSILGGNIGYLDLRSFADVTYAGETAVAAMNFLSASDAVIIDLRNNGGGSPQMIQLITSYLYGSDPVHLNNFYWRPTDSHSQTWTLPHVQGTRRPDIPVYVLTSASTFSAAEEFSYNLKHLDRATLIGETTGGGAHPGGTQEATNRFTVWVPRGRAINPNTNTNWEGKGVIPHIAVPEKEALIKAHQEALQKLISISKDPQLQAQYQWTLDGLKAQQNPPSVSQKTLKTYVGNYGPRVISLENGSLYYQRSGRSKYKLIPYKENAFMLDGLDSFRIKFDKNSDNTSVLIGMYDNGHTDQNERSK